MSGFLLDTNVLSEFNRRGQPDPLVKQWLEAADTGSLYASVLTLGEIRFGVELLPPSKRRTQLEQWLDRTCRNGSTVEFYPLIGRLRIDGDCFAPKRR
jgi:predicted nucleic acid-binding protein